MVSSVFLSHSSKDKPLARRIAQDLRQAGISVWLDEWEILVGDSITQRIEQGLDTAEFVAVLLTEQSVNSGWVEKEWHSQIGQEASANKVIILPLKCGDCIVPPLLKDKKYADFVKDYKAALAQLVNAVQGHSLRSRATTSENGRAQRAKHDLPLVHTAHGRLLGVFKSIPEDIKTRIAEDIWKQLSFQYDRGSGEFELEYRQVHESSWSSHITVHFHSSQYHPISYNFSVENPEFKLCLLKERESVHVERARQTTDDSSPVSDATLECILTNSTPKEAWISDLILAGLGTTNSVCNPRPVRTTDYTLTVEYRDDLSLESESEVVSGGSMTSQYCDGFLFIRIPIFFKIPPKTTVSHRFKLANLRLRKTGFGMYEDRKGRRCFMRKLELLDEKDRLKAETRIQHVFHEAQFQGPMGETSSPLRPEKISFLQQLKRLSRGGSLFTRLKELLRSSISFEPVDDSPFGRVNRQINGILDSYMPTREGEELRSLQKERASILHQLLGDDTTIELRQRLRATISRLDQQISEAQSKLVPFRDIPMICLLRGGSSGSLDVAKELFDPFPAWSTLAIVYVVNKNQIAYEALVSEPYGPGFHSRSDLVEAMKASGVELDLDYVFATPAQVLKSYDTEGRKSRDAAMYGNPV